MRVVLDTNVLLSAILFGGTPGRILAAWRAGQLELVISPDIVEEYFEIGERLSKRYSDVDVQPILALIVQNAIIVPSNPLLEDVCDDPDDDKFLACALTASTEIVVSGDKHLRAVSGHEGISVLTPRQFADQFLIEPGC